jgi:stress-induced morphogen
MAGPAKNLHRGFSFGLSFDNPGLGNPRFSSNLLSQTCLIPDMARRALAAGVAIQDLAGDWDHYKATVIAESFRGKSRVQQHQIIYEALKAEMGGRLGSAGALRPPDPNGCAVLPVGHSWNRILR